MEHRNPPEISLLEDGWVRLRFATLQDIPLVHLVSGLDEEQHAAPLPHGATAAAISGYTEWVSTTVPVISIGWDWWLDTSSLPPKLVLAGEPRSNVMLLDLRDRDIGMVKTAVILEAVVDALAWQGIVREVIRSRYA